MLSHKGTEAINTNRLLLRRFELNDAYDMFRNWANDSEVTKFVSWKPHSSVEATKEILEKWVNEYKNNNIYNWTVELKETGEVIGGICIVKLDEKNYSCEIGYCMSRIYWGKGIMSESLKAVIDYLFSEVGFNRIVAKHDTNNVASGKVMLKSGMNYEGTLRQVKTRDNKEFYDLAVYAILKNDWLIKKVGINVIAPNNAPTLDNFNIILRQPIKKDIAIRANLGLNMECVTMCGGNISKLGEFTLDDAIKWYERIIQHPCKWVIEYNNNCIGAVGLREYKEDNKAKFSIEIYDDNLYGCGIGTNVTKMVLNYAFEILDYHKVYLRVLDYNTRAIKCYEKCGFIKEGIDREGALINGTYCSDIYMEIIRSDYISLVK